MSNSNYLNDDVTPECQGKTFGVSGRFQSKVEALIASAQMGWESLKQKFHLGEYQGKKQGE